MGAHGTVQVSASGEDLFKLSKDLRRAGATLMQKELYAAVQRSGRRIVEVTKESAGTLPAAGGFAERVQGADFRVRLMGGRNPGVRITVNAKSGKPVDVAAVDRTGNVRHPLFGNRHSWHTTKAPAGWFTKPAEATAPDVRKDLEQAVARIERQITGG
jgi:hypothetical protein